MSVINKMLRDLDNRQRADGTLTPAPGLGQDFVRGTSTVNPLGQARVPMPKRNLSLNWVAMAAVLGVCAAAGWYLSRSGQDPMAALAVKSLQPVLVPTPLPGNSPGAVPAVAAIPEVPAKAGVTKGAFVLKMDTQVRLTPHLSRTDNPAAKAKTDKVNVDASRSALTPPKAVVVAKMAGASPAPEAPVANLPVLASAGSIVSASTSTSTSAAAVIPNPSAQRQAAAAEAMSQAQALWTTGSRDAAIELMREAVAVAERGATTGTNPGGSSLLVSLVRELARMELAEGQAARVLDMLTRLEPTIAGQADLWAVRGNAAQRLGRHQDSANAYMRALRLRPDEPRWMLGAAVSLAAQGQTVAATDLAEKARAGGAVSREVAAYLRQLGVPLRDQ